jgi:ribose-phosphate pyrophosphokinase
MPLLGKYIGSIGLDNPVIIAPDEGAAHLARRAASELGIDHDYLEKTRLSGEKVVLKAKKLDVKARDVVIVDDMISTGGTMAETISLLREQGARNVYAACIHPVLSSNAVLKLYDAGTKDIIATDTIEKVVSKVTAAPIIAEAIRGTLK